MVIPLVVDTDGACDDALALWLGVASGRFELALVTTVAGAVSVEVATRNMLSVMDSIGAASVPVFQGADRPQVRELESSEHVLGRYAMSGVLLPEPSRQQLAGSAAEALVNTARELKGQNAVLLALGPLTNLAAALRLDDRLLERFDQVVIMGTATDDVGNITENAEFNTWVDPEAAAEVFAAPGHTTVVGWRACRTASVITPDLHDQIVACPSAFGTFLLETSASLRQFSLALGVENYDLADVLAMAFVVDPQIVTETSVGRITIDADSRGRTVLNAEDDGDGEHRTSATVVEVANPDAFAAMVAALAIAD